ncbi:MAG: hypothetical protein ABH854_00340 [Candidatus Diapherotrites archaeon]|nr:hypothetical protein [Candidatus Micrarchaeota archaeon]MBU1939988.1 hypothetical protein [Candidatus Micrarchaeota archaeon]
MAKKLIPRKKPIASFAKFGKEIEDYAAKEKLGPESIGFLEKAVPVFGKQDSLLLLDRYVRATLGYLVRSESAREKSSKLRELLDREVGKGPEYLERILADLKRKK